MSDENNTAASTTSTDMGRKMMTRQLSGASFLTLEHVGYFVLVVLLPSILLLGASIALGLWQNGSNASSASMNELFSYSVQPVAQFVHSAAAIGVVAALAVLVPLMVVLRRRTAAEYAKRPGYTGRVAYKLPIYTALALLAAQTVGAVGSMLATFLNSLVNIGVKGVDIGAMYVTGFLPALLAFAVFGAATWYVMWFAKGKDLSRSFVSGVVLVSGIMAIALFVTVLTLNHNTKTPEPTRTQNLPYQLDQDYLPY